MKNDRDSVNVRKSLEAILKFTERSWHFLMHLSFAWSIVLGLFAMIIPYFNLATLFSAGFYVAVFRILPSIWFILFLLACIGFLKRLGQATKIIESKYQNPLQRALGKPDEYYNVWKNRQEEIKSTTNLILRAINPTILIATIIVNAFSIAYSFTTLYTAPPPFYTIYPPQMISAITASALLFIKKRNVL